MKPVLVEESTLQDIPQNVETLLLSLVEAFPVPDKNDVICILLYVIMIETGFLPQNVKNSDVSNHDHNFNVQTLSSFQTMPNNWKNIELNIYELLFHLGKFTEYPCKLVILPTGDVLIVDLVICDLNDQRKTYSITIQPSKYIQNLSDVVASSFRDLKELSFKFKNNVSHPAKCAILTCEGIVNSSLLGLPVEIKFRILKKLKLRDITNMSIVCTAFNALCEDQNLWKYILLRDYNSEEVRGMMRLPSINSNIAWKEEYKKRYSFPQRIFSASYGLR